jgi:hypothetical protein
MLMIGKWKEDKVFRTKIFPDFPLSWVRDGMKCAVKPAHLER